MVTGGARTCAPPTFSNAECGTRNAELGKRKFSDADLRTFLDALDAAPLGVTNWEAAFIESTLIDKFTDGHGSKTAMNLSTHFPGPRPAALTLGIVSELPKIQRDKLATIRGPRARAEGGKLQRC